MPANCATPVFNRDLVTGTTTAWTPTTWRVPAAIRDASRRAEEDRAAIKNKEGEIPRLRRLKLNHSNSDLDHIPSLPRLSPNHRHFQFQKGTLPISGFNKNFD